MRSGASFAGTKRYRARAALNARRATAPKTQVSNADRFGSYLWMWARRYTLVVCTTSSAVPRSPVICSARATSAGRWVCRNSSNCFGIIGGLCRSALLREPPGRLGPGQVDTRGHLLEDGLDDIVPCLEPEGGGDCYHVMLLVAL